MTKSELIELIEECIEKRALKENNIEDVDIDSVNEDTEIELNTDILTIEEYYNLVIEENNSFNIQLENLDLLSEKVDFKAIKDKIIKAIKTIWEKIVSFFKYIKTKIKELISKFKNKDKQNEKIIKTASGREFIKRIDPNTGKVSYKYNGTLDAATMKDFIKSGVYKEDFDYAQSKVKFDTEFNNTKIKVPVIGALEKAIDDISSGKNRIYSSNNVGPQISNSKPLLDYLKSYGYKNDNEISMYEFYKTYNNFELWSTKLEKLYSLIINKKSEYDKIINQLNNSEKEIDKESYNNAIQSSQGYLKLSEEILNTLTKYKIAYSNYCDFILKFDIKAGRSELQKQLDHVPYKK